MASGLPPDPPPEKIADGSQNAARPQHAVSDAHDLHKCRAPRGVSINPSAFGRFRDMWLVEFAVFFAIILVCGYLLLAREFYFRFFVRKGPLDRDLSGRRPP